MATLSVLDVLVQVFWPYEGPGTFNHSQRYVRSIRQISPVAGSFVWPPGPRLTDADIKGNREPWTR